ncbi:hypothetical protein N3K66_003168 [Trichothecium roseum]|uniref:Uncharacterized protein n=1 Tax=Trichothecium roseum TaxID=47278 RepID=A0ACC0V4P8_9HYPO|nr:hypothetical protein N3K66_003168 [Trichothecium roseum]
MHSIDDSQTVAVVLCTSFATLIGGFVFGVWSTQGYLISPSLREERRNFYRDPVESDESDVDEGDTVLDHAPNWANAADADRRQGLSAAKKSAAAAAADLSSNEECKLVLVVRTDLGMTKGKIAAQCSHATLACYKTLSRADPASPEGRLLSRWERHGQAKIAVQVKSEDELRDLRRKARALGVTAETIQDAGRTQIEAGSTTVLGVGPAPKSLVDQITGGLKLL